GAEALPAVIRTGPTNRVAIGELDRVLTIAARIMPDATPVELSKLIGVNEVSIRNARRRLGLTFGVGRRRIIWTPELRAELMSCIEKGWGVDRMARHLGVIPSSLVVALADILRE